MKGQGKNYRRKNSACSAAAAGQVIYTLLFAAAAEGWRQQSLPTVWLYLVMGEADLVVQHIFAVFSLFSHPVDKMTAWSRLWTRWTALDRLLSRRMLWILTLRISWKNSDSQTERFQSCTMDGIYFISLSFCYMFKKLFGWITGEEWFPLREKTAPCLGQ